MPLAVNEQSEEINLLACEWPVLEALQAGTPAMRNARMTYLPQWPNEEAASYTARLATATLFPAYRRTVNVMASKPFAKALVLSDDTPESIVTWAEDIDLQGVSLHAFAAEMFNETVGYGLAGILVEYPAEVSSAGLTVAQLEASGRRPYFVRVMHDQILGYKTESVAGRVRLTQLRLAESTTEDDGEYGTKTIPCVRVLRPGSWEVWKQTTDKNWVLEASGTTSLAEIPFVPLYGVRDGFMVGKPALLDLAYLNVKHWQSQSDQDTILHVARVPILAMIGAEDETQLTVGAMAAVKLPDKADLKFVEHSGASIEAGKQSLLQLEEQMVQTGAELLVQKPGARTATEDANDAEGNKSDLQRMAENFEDALDQALSFMAQFASLPSGGSVYLFNDYGAATLSDASAVLLKDLQMAGLLSKETTLKELQRRGFLSPDLSIDEELEKAEADGPPLGAQLDMLAIGAKQDAKDDE
ncbi:62kDa structural protein [Lysobacter dokdonensis DS-58]|uniref:62kDa structural protein n=1 Tax=Lysobacter dokdonensis DS-58 TaxID=1300345 RepID=A0A0A2X3T2_9GAMM|nr:DUF4055 domain-containing protein [Lysobacter dokdonensis]KGQ19919.1 62kDa structural protein [Lysobacter dokdonensis DS-58]